MSLHSGGSEDFQDHRSRLHRFSEGCSLVRNHIFVGRALRLPFSSTHGKRCACPTTANKKLRFIKQNHAEIAWLDSSLPASALPASGSRGRPTTGPLSHSAPPQYLFQNKTSSLQVNATKNCSGVCIKRRVLERRLAQAPLQLWFAAPCSLALFPTFRLPPVSHWCGKSPAIRPLPFSKPIRH